MLLDPPTAEDEEFVREMRMTLNKLTVEKFDALSDKIIQQIAGSTRPNRGVPTLMQLVFEKATTEHHFINMYVDLCVKLHSWFTQSERVTTMELQSDFRRILLNQCQTSFEAYLEPPEGFEGLRGTELYEAQVKYKTKMLGNIRLVGQLVRHGMLAPKIALAVALELAREDPIVREERLETLAVFLETVGPTLDDPNWPKHTEFAAIFGQIKRVVVDSSICCRIRCLLQDVLDLRRSGWQTRKLRDLEREMPSTIAEVHLKAKLTGLGLTSTPQRGSLGFAANTGRAEAKKRSNAGRLGISTGGPSNENAARDANLLVGTSPSSSSYQRNSQLREDGGGRNRPLHEQSVASKMRAKTEDLSSAGTRISRGRAEPAAGPGKVPTISSISSPATGSAAITEAPAVLQKSPEELLVCFHRELAKTLRQLGAGLDVATAAQHLRGSPLPPGCALDEAIDLIVRIVDEPRARRKQLMPLLPALFAVGVFTPPTGLSQVIEAFARDAFADPGGTDPPDLADVVLGELLPALGLSPRKLTLPLCLTELVGCTDSCS